MSGASLPLSFSDLRSPSHSHFLNSWCSLVSYKSPGPTSSLSTSRSSTSLEGSRLSRSSSRCDRSFSPSSRLKPFS